MDLKNCPFCGGTPEIIASVEPCGKGLPERYDLICKIDCQGCTASTTTNELHTPKHQVMTTFDDLRHAAIADWERRVHYEAEDGV